jgi:hypothetical protein
MIQVSGPNVQGFLGAATDTSGQYIIPFLPVGKNYQVEVEGPGYNSVIRKGIEVPLGSTISLPFVLSQGKTEIVVTAAAPVIDVRRPRSAPASPTRWSRRSRWAVTPATSPSCRPAW